MKVNCNGVMPVSCCRANVVGLNECSWHDALLWALPTGVPDCCSQNCYANQIELVFSVDSAACRAVCHNTSCSCAVLCQAHPALHCVVCPPTRRRQPTLRVLWT